MRDIEKLAAFLRDHHPSRFCVGCLGRQLHLSVDAVTVATIDLGLAAEYGFTDGKCSLCSRHDALLGLKRTPG